MKIQKNKKATLGAAVAVFTAAGLLLSGCSSSTDSAPTNEETPSASASESPAAEEQYFDPSVSPQDLETLRTAVQAFEQKIREDGGVQFDVISPSDNNFAVRYSVNANRDYLQSWVTPEGDPQESRFLGDRVYTVVPAISPDLKEWVDKIDPDAKWYSEPRTSQFSPIGPSRIVESVLPYAERITCTPRGGTGLECEVIANGMNNIPGIGGFEIPATGVNMTVFIEDGMIQDIKLFQGNENFERRIESFIFQPTTIVAPPADETIEVEAIGEYVAQTTPEGEEPDPNRETNTTE